MALSEKVVKKYEAEILELSSRVPGGMAAERKDILRQVREEKKCTDLADSSIYDLISQIRKNHKIDVRHKIETLSNEEYLEKRKELSVSSKVTRHAAEREKYLLEQIDKLEKLLNASAHISKTPQIYKIEKQKAVHSQSTPIIFASDWHYEEIVKPETVSGLNEFTLQIADKRIQNFIRNSTRLLDIHSRDTEIRDVIFCLGGDFITGDIHRDNIESCQLSPTEAAWATQNHLASCIEHYLKETDFNFIIPCHSGNHARTTKEQLWANESGHSLEWLMYQNLKRWFAKEKRLTFMIAEGLHLYIDVNGFIERTHHGHAVKYGGGVGGVTIPMNKAISQWNKARKADHDSCGHFHGYFSGSNFTINGSLIGYSPFGVSIKGDYEKPVQAFSLINHEQKMISISAKIFLE